MKKLLTGMFTLAFAASAQAAPASTQQQGTFFKPYIGAEYQYTHVNYGSAIDGILDDSLHGGAINIGARVHRNLGVEVGYMATQNGEEDNVRGTAIDSKTSMRGFTVDVMGYLPVGERMELIGTAGLVHLRSEVELSAPGFGVATADNTDTNGRVGVGAQYWLSDNLNLRGLVRYQQTDYNDTDAITANIGVNYQF